MPDNQHTCNDNEKDGAPYEETRGNTIYTYQDYVCSVCKTHMNRQQVSSRKA